ncbi:hypothetical protein [Paenarthrobacter histidinolovorans]|uniref:Uncharacterized protein n=1 Tax=Paenarthrobacter histidinolovorans TaxID=43664 RepID=A0ABW8N9T9_9MICC
MGEIRAGSRLNIVEISGFAWAETVRRAAEAMDSGAEADFAAYQDSLQAQVGDSQETGDELRRAGIVDAHGVMSPQWILAVHLAASAPLKASTVVQSNHAVPSVNESVHTEIGLAGGRGVGISYRRRISHQANGVVVTEVRNAVEVSFFLEEDAWAAVSRHFPDLRRLEPLPEATPGETAANATCTIHLDVSARPAFPAGSRPYISRRVWAVADQLYAAEAGPGGEAATSLTAVPATDIAREFAWSLLGAREYLGSAAERSVSA